LCARLGKKQRAEVADHYPSTRKELLARNVPDPDDEKYLRALCRRCHSRHGKRSMMRFNNDPA
jgi:5-methylcytosine-specific restriction protein A